jgi:putative selenium metabolism hydrolase
MTELELAQALIRQESLSGQESKVMAVMQAAFSDLGFDEAYIDKAGNAIGVFRRGAGPTVMLNGHLDTVPLGEESRWEYSPLSGHVAKGELWGRGSVDMKSALACMALSAKDAIEAGFKGTLIVSAVVQEEVGGLGARFIAENLKPEVVILGEPSDLSLMLGHRGRAEFQVTFHGKIAHAAKNELGVNALYKASSFLEKLKTLDLSKGGPLGGSSLTPTQLISYPHHGVNVVPGRAEITIDYRTIPEDDEQGIIQRLQALDVEAEIISRNVKLFSESGAVSYTIGTAPCYIAPGENSFVQLARPVIKETLATFALPLRERMWWFCTDAPYLSASGAPVIGFGPGLEDLAHTTSERVPIKHLEIARKVYADLVLAYSKK